MPSGGQGKYERGLARAEARSQTAAAHSHALIRAVADDRKANVWDCGKRLRSCGYAPRRHVRKHGDWHVFETDRGIVAVTRHPGGRWEIRPFTPPETKGEDRP
jgi:hypothetical protein